MKKSVVLVNAKKDLLNQPLHRKPWKNKETIVLCKSVSRFTKTTVFFCEILGFKGRGS